MRCGTKRSLEKNDKQVCSYWNRKLQHPHEAKYPRAKTFEASSKTARSSDARGGSGVARRRLARVKMIKGEW